MLLPQLVRAQAQDHSNRPLRLIVPQGRGQGSDIGASLVGERLGRALDQQSAVENRTGAVGSIGNQGSPQAPNDLLSAKVDLIRGPLATALLQVKAGKLRILAVISAQWPAFAPAVPTMAQAGVPNVGCMAWLGFFVPTGTPKDVTGRLGSEPMKVQCHPTRPTC